MRKNREELKNFLGHHGLESTHITSETGPSPLTNSTGETERMKKAEKTMKTDHLNRQTKGKRKRKRSIGWREEKKALDSLLGG